MSWFKNLRIRTKLYLAFAFVALVAGGTGWVGITALHQSGSNSTMMYQSNTLAQQYLGEAMQYHQRSRIALRDVALADDPKTASERADACRQHRQHRDEAISRLEPLVPSLGSEAQQAFADFKRLIPENDSFQDQIISTAQAGDVAKAKSIIFGSAKTAAEQLQAQLDQLAKAASQDAHADAVGIVASADKAHTVMVILLILGLVAAVVMATALNAAVAGPLARGLDMMRELSRGHLGQRLALDRHDEVGLLAQSMDEFADDLQKRVVGSLQSVSEGRLDFTLQAKDERDEVTPALQRTVTALRELVAESTRLSQAAVEGKLSTRADAGKFQGDYRAIVQGVNNTLDAVIGPLNVAATYVDRISKGDIPPQISDNYNGDFNAIKNNLNTCISAVNQLVSDAGLLSQAAVEGKLSTRADASRHQGDFRKIVQGVNDTLDAVIGPLNVAASYVDRISKGDIPEKITGAYNGDFNTIKNNLNTCCDALSGLIREMNHMSDEHNRGDIDVTIPAEKFQGAYHDMAAGVNGMVGGHIAVKKKAMACLAEFGRGNFNAPLEKFPGKKAFINETMEQVRTNLQALINDASRLSQAAVEGKLSTRADASAHQGDFRKIVQGVNDTLDAVIGPLNVAATYVERISKGDIPPRITDNYNGDFNTIKNNLNTCIHAVNQLVADAGMLSKAAVEGKLSTRADASKHQGDFQKVVQGVNDTLDAVVLPIQEAAQVLEQVADRDLSARVKGDYRGDLARIKEALNQAVDNLDQGLQQVALAVEQVAAASGQIGSGSQAVAQGASEQASSLEEVSSSLQEMASMTRRNTGNAKDARNQAEGARSGANQGLESMQRLSEAMEKIKSSSDSTAKIVKTIDEIAFQTNLLALNAAVEAARAGDAGKGFAVVAEEVRNLAMRSAEAAKNTANMIEESVHNAEGGVALNLEVLAKLQEINGQANKVGEMMGEISAGSEQQQSGIDQITSAMEQMNQLTQQNAASSEESASAAEELSGQAEELRTMVSQFKLSAGQKGNARFGGGHGTRGRDSRGEPAVRGSDAGGFRKAA